ncbi:hypothetical protein ACFYZ8_26720 [Streptomyces sp. NPDC001668]|uniref:hypothetical protein n=1 Tax=unclassified Streptomyces TaxID=2593676 RepID=UPI0036A9A2DA
MKLLDGMTADVTGARGLGRACATRLAGEGADLVLVDIAEDPARSDPSAGTETQLPHTAELSRSPRVRSADSVRSTAWSTEPGSPRLREGGARDRRGRTAVVIDTDLSCPAPGT